MPIKYKLTDQKFQTYGGCQWGEGVTHETDGKGSLCGPGWLHVYDSPELAVLLNPIHANFQNPVLWKCRVSGNTKNDRGLKRGYTKVTTLKQIDLPSFSLEQRIKFTIFCALSVCKNKDFAVWAKNWLSGEDRSYAAAEAAYAAARDAAYAAARDAAAYAVDSSAYAADSAAHAAVKPLDLLRIAKKALKEAECEPRP